MCFFGRLLHEFGILVIFIRLVVVVLVQLNFVILLSCPVNAILVVLAAHLVHLMFIEVVPVWVVETAFLQLVEPILVVRPWFFLNFLMAECLLRSILASPHRSCFVNTLIVVVASFCVEAPLVEKVPLFVVEAAIFKDEKFVFIVFSCKFLDLFSSLFRAFNHTY